MALNQKEFNRKLAYMPVVQAAVQKNADIIEARANSLFASHDRPGGHSIGSQTRGPDRFVYLKGPKPLSVEYGHFTPSGETYVEGLHIMGKAAKG